MKVSLTIVLVFFVGRSVVAQSNAGAGTPEASRMSALVGTYFRRPVQNDYHQGRIYAG